METNSNAVYMLSVHDDMLVVCMMLDAAGRKVWYVSRKDDTTYVSQSNYSVGDALGRFIIHGQRKKRDEKHTHA